MKLEQKVEESSAYSLFVYAVRSPVTRDYYLRRLRIFFNHINLLHNETMEERCNYFGGFFLYGVYLMILVMQRILAP